PDAKPVRIEPFVKAWRGGAPDIDVENAPELLRRGKGHEFRTILEAPALNDAMKHLGLQARDDLREVVCVQEPIEECPRFRHGPANDSGPLNGEPVLKPRIL